MDTRGFTLLEVLVALVLLGIVMLGAQSVLADRLVRDVGRENQRAVALQIAKNRLQQIQADPGYNTLLSTHAVTDDSVPGNPGYRVTTALARTATYTVATVQVLTPGGRDSINRTTVVGQP